MRHLFFWGVPLLVVFLLIVSGFLYWLLATPTGTRWAVNTAAVQFDGESHGVEGSIWHGLSINYLTLNLPNQLFVHVDQAEIKVDWKQLWERQTLHVSTLSVEQVTIKMDGEPAPPHSDAPDFSVPHLPIAIELEQAYVGAVDFTQQGHYLPVDLSNLQLSMTGFLREDLAEIKLGQIKVGYEDIRLEASGYAQLNEFSAPWDSLVKLEGKLSSKQEASQICLKHYLPEHLQAHDSQCELSFQADWQGSLDEGAVAILASGQGLSVNAHSNLQLNHPFPLRETKVDIDLPDQSGANVVLHWENNAVDTSKDRLFGDLSLRDFDVGAWVPGSALKAKLSAKASYEATFSESVTLLDHAVIKAEIGENSQWNQQPLRGHVRTQVQRLHTINQKELPAFWQTYTLSDTDINLQAGVNKLELKGAFGLESAELQLLADLPSIATLWPNLEPIGATKIDAALKGTLFNHQLTLKAKHLLENKQSKAKVGNGPVEALLTVKGVWDPNATQPSWKGDVQSIQAEHAGLSLDTTQPFLVNVALPSEQQELNVDVGAFGLQLYVDKQRWLLLQNQGTQYGPKGFKTKGYSDPIVFSTKRVELLTKRLGLAEPDSTRGAVVDKREVKVPLDDLAIKFDWDVSLLDALQGTVRIQRQAGDIMIPAQPSFPLGLDLAELVVNIKAGSGGRSVIRLDAEVRTKNMGYITITGNTPVYYSKEKGIQIRKQDAKELSLDAHMDSLSWTSLILQDQVDLGGALDAQIKLRSTPSGGFTTHGAIRGKNLKVTRLDDGVRLLDGDLEAEISDNLFTVKRLYFPAQLRVEPKEWRTATWIRESPDAQNGYLSLTGYWDLEKNNGNFKTELYRYPILQRADRYAMVSGQLNVEARLPDIDINGKLTADAGWFNLDMLGGIPTVDSDVVVIRSTDPVKTSDQKGAEPVNMTLNLEVDLGPRFYLTGYGVNSGLVGQLQIHMSNGQITALGALNTRGGAISIYGQRLQLRRGTVTFQGDIANPLLDIQALRTGLSVDAGVKVGGTARKPKIDLISTPEVSELEKLSWLLFGHGPDDSSGDLALLLSVGSSFLGDGEPFYRKFGIDELSMRSGELGGAGSVLPSTSTASSTESEVTAVERRFVEATKVISSDITASIRQALADTGTVGRATYKLSRRLTAELSVGTVSGLALIYRWFSRD